MALFPLAHANNHITTAQGFLDKINDAILFPLIVLLMGLALLIFLWGAFQYVLKSGSEEGRETGRRHLMWGIIGMLIMLSAYALLEIAAGTFDLQNELNTSIEKDRSGGDFTNNPFGGEVVNPDTGGGEVVNP